MLFRSLALFVALASPAFGFAPANTPLRATSLGVATEPMRADELVTKEANIKGTRRTKPTIDPLNPQFEQIRSVPYDEAFPSSTKEYKTVTHEETGHVLNVPFRRVHLEDTESPTLDLYDTSGPQGHDPKLGLPKLRKEWVDAREGKHERYTQMHFARKNMITEEMAFTLTTKLGN